MIYIINDEEIQFTQIPSTGATSTIYISVDKKYIIIPVEVKVRDFHSRLLLALFLKDFNVIFGSQDQIISLIGQ